MVMENQRSWKRPGKVMEFWRPWKSHGIPQILSFLQHFVNTVYNFGIQFWQTGSLGSQGVATLPNKRQLKLY
jgi:hypothetical protein